MKVIATDISESALKVAFINAKNHRVEDRISFQKGNLMEPISDLKEPFLIVSNPPYIPSDAKVGSDVEKFEPHSALFAGAGGLDVILPLVEAASKHPFCQGIVLECREDQVETIQKIPVFS
jgi:release factor glutamine methyltransferase